MKFDKKAWYLKNKKEINARRRAAHDIEQKKKKQIYRAENKERMAARDKVYYAKHKERIAARAKIYQAKNKEKIAVQRKIHYIENKEKARIYNVEHKKERNERQKKRGATDSFYNLNSRMRTRVWNSLHRKTGNKFNRSWKVLVDYTVEDLKRHLEKQFTKNMTWDRFLRGEIWIDHKIPISAFNFTKPEHQDFRRCWALSNLQPMWALENISKGAKIDKPFQPMLAM